MKTQVQRLIGFVVCAAVSSCADFGGVDDSGAAGVGDDRTSASQELAPKRLLPTTRTYDGQGGLAIPDNNTTGISSRASVPDRVVVGAVSVELNIEHTYIGDLSVTLSKGNVVRTLHNHEGGGTDNIARTFAVTGFAGASALGDWTLRIVDNAAQDVGTLVSWRLKVTPAAGTAIPTELVYGATPGLAIPDNNLNGVSHTINVPVKVAARGVTIDVNISHTYIGDLAVTVTHGGRTRTLHQHSGGATDNISASYPVSDFNGLSTAGPWTIRVVDASAQDVGTLQSWAVRTTP